MARPKRFELLTPRFVVCHISLKDLENVGNSFASAPITTRNGAHLVRDEGVAGSNPATPTTTKPTKYGVFCEIALEADSSPPQVTPQFLLALIDLPRPRTAGGAFLTLAHDRRCRHCTKHALALSERPPLLRQQRAHPSNRIQVVNGIRAIRGAVAAKAMTSALRRPLAAPFMRTPSFPPLRPQVVAESEPRPGAQSPAPS